MNGYDVKHSFAEGTHSDWRGGSIMPEMLRWRRRDYRKSQNEASIHATPSFIRNRHAGVGFPAGDRAGACFNPRSARWSRARQRHSAPGQLESSLRARAQLEKEGFPSVGDPDYLRSQGAPGLWMVSKATGHGTSPLVRQRLDAFLKEHGDKGQSSPDHIRFLTYTTRYNRDYWVSLDRLEKHYERAEVDAQRTGGGAAYDIKTKNLTRLVLRETEHAREIRMDGQTLQVKAGPEIRLDKNGSAWKVVKNVGESGLHKTHALQGPIDDAFLDPFLLVRPTGKPWNDEVNQQALRTMARFERLWGRFFRGHPFVKD